MLVADSWFGPWMDGSWFEDQIDTRKLWSTPTEQSFSMLTFSDVYFSSLFLLIFF
jgi:hypothetical protein